MTETKNLLLVGVGGQGTILASKILSNALLAAGFDVKMSEVHGMAQRGGSVSTQIRYGEKVHSPVIGAGQADILVSFEAMEALRWLPWLKPSGSVIVNDRRIPSTPILMGKVDYPDDAIEKVRAKVPTLAVSADRIAAGLGDARAMNVVLLGALASAMSLEALDWKRTIADNVKPAFLALNLAAFEAGLSTKAQE